MPEGEALVEGDGDVGGLFLAQDVEQHGGEAEDRVGQLTLGGLQVVGQGVEGAIGQRVAVDQDQGLLLGHAAPPVLEAGYWMLDSGD